MPKAEMKRCCTNCENERPLDQFYVRNNGTVYTTCKSCENARAQDYRTAKPWGRAR